MIKYLVPDKDFISIKNGETDIIAVALHKNDLKSGYCYFLNEKQEKFLVKLEIIAANPNIKKNKYYDGKFITEEYIFQGKKNKHYMKKELYEFIKKNFIQENIDYLIYRIERIENGN